jgi:hypothetical protein
METKHVKEKPTENPRSEKISGPHELWLQRLIPTADRFVNSFQPTIRNSLSGVRKRGIQWGLQALREHIHSFCIATLRLSFF